MIHVPLLGWLRRRFASRPASSATSERVRVPACGARRDAETWAAIREAYVAGAPAHAVARRFGVSVSAMTRRARREGWRRCDLARGADHAAANRLDNVQTKGGDQPHAARGGQLGAHAPYAAAAAVDPRRVVAQVFAAADAAIARAAAASLQGDDAAADAAMKLAEKLTRTAGALAQMRAKTPPPLDPESEAAAAAPRLLADLDKALDGGRRAQSVEVDALSARGVDPREGWRWDAEAEIWVWDPGPKIASGEGPSPSASANAN